MPTDLLLRYLPKDMQILIFQILESSNIFLNEKKLRSIVLPTKKLPLNIFPNIPLATTEDDRDLAYVEAMIGQYLPPIIICNNQWIDGRYRLWALRKMKAKNVICIDLQTIICSYPYPPIALLKLG